MHRTWGINEARDDKIFPPQSNHQCLARHEFCLPQRGNKERTKFACLILSHPTPAQMCVCTRTINLQNTHFLLVLFLELPIPLLSHLSYSHKCWGHFMGMAKCLRHAPPKPTLPCASFPYPKMKARRPWSNQCLTILNAQPNVDMDAMIVVLGDLGGVMGMKFIIWGIWVGLIISFGNGMVFHASDLVWWGFSCRSQPVAISWCLDEVELPNWVCFFFPP